MSLQFYLGASGAGKSHKLHRDITELAKKHRDRNFLFIVPDQFTMQTQIDLVMASQERGIMNVDVLSFSRLAHRIFEEVGVGRKLVLDDTGKNLVLRHLATELSDRMPVLGRNLNKPGYIHEIKSAISEFKQYDISSEELDRLIAFSARRGMLSGKLRDLRLIYEGFNKDIENRYITSEETLTLLREVLPRSGVIRNSYVIFDGFTGFTPVQYRLIHCLLGLTDRVIVSVTIDSESEPFKMKGEQELFYLSRKTILDLQKLAEETNTKLCDDVILKDTFRFKKGSGLSHLERKIFRYPMEKCDSKIDDISIFEARDPENEVRRVLITIRNLVLDEGYQYRDIAAVCGDLGTYEDEFMRQAPRYGIPVFIDRTRGILFHPATEFIRSALLLIKERFSYDAVFHFLRSGLTGIPREEIDRLENYVLSCGIRGRKRYEEPFIRLPGRRAGKEDPGEAAEELRALNGTRETLMKILEPLLHKPVTAGDHVRALREFLLRNDTEGKLLSYGERFREEGDPERASEYEQIYGLIGDLLTKIEELIGEEKIPLTEFLALLESGFQEIDVGTIPGGVDRCVVGDMERSRISEVKVLFFLGVNDGNIPRSGTGGGIISDMDREFLKDAGIPLSPTPREKIYIQRLYLYLFMTKPSERLYLSYSRTGRDGRSLKESYLIPQLLKMFPSLEIIKTDVMNDAFSSVMGVEDGLSVLSQALREYQEGSTRGLTDRELAALYAALTGGEDAAEKARKLLADSAFAYKEHPLSASLAKALYGTTLTNSVSRLERFYACAYAHFLQYGLRLSEREEQEFERSDLGNIYHEVLYRFALRLSREGYTLRDYPEEKGAELLREELLAVSASYGEQILHASAANEYLIERIYGILLRSVETMKTQLLGGDFVPELFEYGFTESIPLDREGLLKLTGRIDRIDLYREEGKLYIKVVDFKSGDRKIELDSFLYGLQMQQPLYMLAARRKLGETYPDLSPEMAAMLYYHVDDPLLPGDSLPDPENLEKDMLSALRPKGLVTGDREVLTHLDHALSEPSVRSLFIPVSTIKDGVSSASDTIGKEDYRLMEDYVLRIAAEAGKRILSGDIAIDPKRHGNSDSCQYCSYKEICPFDGKLPGYVRQNLPVLKDKEALEKIRECL